MDDMNARISHLEQKYAEILALLKELSRTVGGTMHADTHAVRSRTINAKAIIRQGMTAYHSGAAGNPFAASTDEHEFWQSGHDHARDTWDEIRK
jgi:hypothetical protein